MVQLVSFDQIPAKSHVNHRLFLCKSRFSYSCMDKVDFVLGIVMKNVDNEIVILGVFELIQYHHTKYRKIKLY